MTELSMPFDAVETASNVYDREYNALEFAKYLGGIVETGVMKGALQELKLSNTGANMQTVMANGIAYIAINGAVHYYENDSPLTLTHDTESIGLNRIDRIVLRLDLNTSARQIKAHIKKGVAAANPVAPALTRNELVYELSVGQVKIVGGQTFIPTNAITQHVGTETSYATSKILPNYNDATLQGVLNQVTTASANLDNHIKSYVLHTYYGTATGANAKTISLNPAPSTLVDGMAVVFKNATANTSAVTLNVNGKGAKPIIKADGTAVLSGDLKAGSIYTVRYNASTSNFILQGEGGGGFTAGDYLVTSLFEKYFSGYNPDNAPLVETQIYAITPDQSGIYRLKFSAVNQNISGTFTIKLYKGATLLQNINVPYNGYNQTDYSYDIPLGQGETLNVKWLSSGFNGSSNRGIISNLGVYIKAGF